MLHEECTSVVETPFQGHRDNVECERMDLDPPVTTIPALEVSRHPNCTHGARPLFVFRASNKSLKRWSFTFSCRAVVNHSGRRNKNQDGSLEGLGGLWVASASAILWGQGPTKVT